MCKDTKRVMPGSPFRYRACETSHDISAYASIQLAKTSCIHECVVDRILLITLNREKLNKAFIGESNNIQDLCDRLTNSRILYITRRGRLAYPDDPISSITSSSSTRSDSSQEPRPQYPLILNPNYKVQFNSIPTPPHRIDRPDSGAPIPPRQAWSRFDS